MKTKESNSAHNLPIQSSKRPPPQKKTVSLETSPYESKFTITKFYYSLTFQIISIQITCKIFNLSKNQTHSYIKTNKESNPSTSVIQSQKEKQISLVTSHSKVHSPDSIHQSFGGESNSSIYNTNRRVKFHLNNVLYPKPPPKNKPNFSPYTASN